MNRPTSLGRRCCMPPWPLRKPQPRARPSCCAYNRCDSIDNAATESTAQNHKEDRRLTHCTYPVPIIAAAVPSNIAIVQAYLSDTRARRCVTRIKARGRRCCHPAARVTITLSSATSAAYPSPLPKITHTHKLCTALAWAQPQTSSRIHSSRGNTGAENHVSPHVTPRHPVSPKV